MFSLQVLACNRQIYAMKRVRLANKDPEAIRGFIDEIALLKKLRNTPNIIQLINAQVRCILSSRGRDSWESAHCQIVLGHAYAKLLQTVSSPPICLACRGITARRVYTTYCTANGSCLLASSVLAPACLLFDLAFFLTAVNRCSRSRA